MNDSLTLILPVHNAEGWLAVEIERLLELLAELTPAFELAIVDDGSVDDTPEIARQYTRQFPQVSLHRQPLRYGAMSALQRGLRSSTGDFVCIPSAAHEIQASELWQLWNTRSHAGLVMSSYQRSTLTSFQPVHQATGARWIRVDGPSPTSLRLLRRAGLTILGKQLDAASNLTIQSGA